MATENYRRRVFIQDSTTKLLLTEDRQWTSNAQLARDFQNAVNALAFCLNHGLTGAQILFRSEPEGITEFVLTMSGETERVSSPAPAENPRSASVRPENVPNTGS